VVRGQRRPETERDARRQSDGQIWGGPTDHQKKVIKKPRNASELRSKVTTGSRIPRRGAAADGRTARPATARK